VLTGKSNDANAEQSEADSEKDEGEEGGEDNKKPKDGKQMLIRLLSV
jgi:hypothetical protein